MAKKNILFKAQEWKSRQSAAAFLRELAEKLDAGTVTLRRGEEEVVFSLPETLELDIELTEKVKPNKTDRELEIEIEWTEQQVEGPVTLG